MNAPERAGRFPAPEPRPDDGVAHVLVVDDLPANTRVLEALLVREGYRVTCAENGQQALDIVSKDRPDLVLLDILMPKVDGYEVCRRLKADPATRLIPVVLVTGLTDTDSRIRGLEVGADDFMSKPFIVPEMRARVASLLRIKRYTDALDSAESVILSLAMTIEARDRATEGHCQRLAQYAVALGERLGLAADDLDALRIGGYLHDIGKVGIPDRILLKDGQLTPDEYDFMKRHTLIGDHLCAELRMLKPVRPIVRHHHEHLDGTGYPDGLKGDEIPLLAQIMGVVDVFDALTTSRPYKPALSVDDACAVLRDEVRRHWRRADLVETFIDLLGERGLVRVERERIPA
ncbi:MAG: HD domain-containing phosphohydrolase [Vicinamibacterales bacterium]